MIILICLLLLFAVPAAATDYFGISGPVVVTDGGIALSVMMNDTGVDVTGTVVVIDSIHNNIHAGNYFFIKGATVLQIGDSLVFATVTADSTQFAHMMYAYASSGGCSLYVYEDATFTGGDSITPFNANRNSGRESGVVSSNAGCDLGENRGNLISTSAWGGGGNKGTSGSTEMREQLILKSASTYVWVVVSTANDNYVDYHGAWYEASAAHIESE